MTEEKSGERARYRSVSALDRGNQPVSDHAVYTLALAVLDVAKAIREAGGSNG